MNFDKLSLEELETKALTLKDSYNKDRKQFIMVLNYIKTTHRWRENPQYKNASFAEYLNGKYHLPIGTFESEKRAFIVFPKEVETFDLGIVRETMNKVAPLKQQHCLKEIETKQASKKTPITFNEIKETIKKYAKQPPKNTQAEELKRLRAADKTNTRLIEEYKETIAQLNAFIIELQAQLAKAQKSVVLKNKLVDKYVRPFIDNFEHRASA